MCNSVVYTCTSSYGQMWVVCLWHVPALEIISDFSVLNGLHAAMSKESAELYAETGVLLDVLRAMRWTHVNGAPLRSSF